MRSTPTARPRCGEAALAHESTGPSVWVHGDVTGSNVLLDGDRLCGVIDFGCSAVGDPACDLTPTWTMFEGPSRDRFKAMLPLDDGTWARGRGWALWKALIEIPGRLADDPGRTGARFGWRWDARGSSTTSSPTTVSAPPPDSLRLRGRCRHAVRQVVGSPAQRERRRPDRWNGTRTTRSAGHQGGCCHNVGGCSVFCLTGWLRRRRRIDKEGSP